MFIFKVLDAQNVEQNKTDARFPAYFHIWIRNSCIKYACALLNVAMTMCHQACSQLFCNRQWEYSLTEHNLKSVLVENNPV